MLEDLKNVIIPLVQSYFSKHNTIEVASLDEFLEAMGLLEEWKSEKDVLWTLLFKYAVNGEVVQISAIKALIELLSSMGEAELSRISRISLNPIATVFTPNLSEQKEGVELDSIEFSNGVTKVFNDYTSETVRKIRSLFFAINIKAKDKVTSLEINDMLSFYPFYYLTYEDISTFISVFSIKRNEEYHINREYFVTFYKELNERVSAYLKASETQNNDNYTEDISNFNEFFSEVHQTEEEAMGCLRMLFPSNGNTNHSEEHIQFFNREIRFLSTQRLQKIEAIKSFISKQKEDVQCLENDLYLMHEKCLEKDRHYANEEDSKKGQYLAEINNLNTKLISKDKDVCQLKEEIRQKEMDMGSLLDKNLRIEKEFEEMRKKFHRLNEEKENYKKEYYNKLNECLENINKEKRPEEKQPEIAKEANTIESKISREANPLFESMKEFGLVEQTRNRLQLMDFEKLLAYSVKVDIDNQQLQSDKVELMRKNQEMLEEIQELKKLSEGNKQEISILKSTNERLENKLAEITDDLEQKAKFDSTIDPLLIRISRMSQLEPVNNLSKVNSNLAFKSNKNASQKKIADEIIEEEDDNMKSMAYETAIEFAGKDEKGKEQFGLSSGGNAFEFSSNTGNVTKKQYDTQQGGSLNYEGGGLTFQKKKNNEDNLIACNSDDSGDIDLNNELYFDSNKNDIFQKIRQSQLEEAEANNSNNKVMSKKWQASSTNTFNASTNMSHLYSDSNQMVNSSDNPKKKLKKVNTNTMSQYFCTERLKEKEKNFYNKKVTGSSMIKEEEEGSKRQSCRSQSPQNKKASSKKLNAPDLRESIPIFQGETKEDVQKRILTRQNEHTSYDFMSFKLDDKISDIFDSNNEILNSKDMFSDNVFLIDPVKNKKHKFNILITPNSIYILKVRDLNVHQKYERAKLYEISISDKNSNLLCFHFDSIEELLVESLRRTEMLIFIRDYEILKGNSKVKFKYMDTFSIVRNNRTIMCVTNSERLAVVPNFENAKKMGYLYLMKDVFFVNTFKEKFVVLTDVGLLVFDDLSKDPKYLPIINSIFNKCQEGAYKRPFCFEIKTIRKKDVYVFAAKNQDDFDSWMNQFNLMTNEYKTKLKRLDTKPTDK